MALQTELFLVALRRFEATGRVSRELEELGGDFAQKARENRWVEPDGRLVMSSAERRVAFQIRWTMLTGLGDSRGLRPTLVERRLYYGFLLRHPETSDDDLPEDRALRSLAYLNALANLDPDYPADFGRGVLYFRAGRYRQSMDAFERHLDHHPTGPWTLRARNVWLAAARQVEGRP
jgi:hypothetical protein